MLVKIQELLPQQVNSLWKQIIQPPHSPVGKITLNITMLSETPQQPLPSGVNYPHYAKGDPTHNPPPPVSIIRM